MRYLLAFTFLLFCATGSAQQITYSEWKKLATEDIRLLPEYGHAAKSEGQIAADNELIATELKENGTHRKASDALIKVGFTYLYRGDLKTAMYRFNQAYLLDATNENIYWGFGAIYGSFGDYPAALEQYDKGLAINPNNALILTDKATIYFVNFQQEQGKDKSKLDTAINLLTKSFNIDQKSENTTFKLSVCYFWPVIALMPGNTTMPVKTWAANQSPLSTRPH
jgi:tetratricopeptide (TPR) repeat protein